MKLTFLAGFLLPLTAFSSPIGRTTEVIEHCEITAEISSVTRIPVLHGVATTEETPLTRFGHIAVLKLLGAKDLDKTQVDCAKKYSEGETTLQVPHYEVENTKKGTKLTLEMTRSISRANGIETGTGTKPADIEEEGWLLKE